MRRGVLLFTLAADQRALLEHWVRSGTMAQRIVRRSRVVLTLEGHGVRETAAIVGVSPRTVTLWRRRFLEGGPSALAHDAPGRGRKSRLEGAGRAQLCEAQAQAMAAGHCSVRALAAALGVSRSAVHRALHKADAQGARRDA